MYVADTNVFIAAMNGRDERVVAKLIAERGRLFMSAIVLHELLFGAANSQNIEKNMARVRNIALPLLPFDNTDAFTATGIRASLRRRGTPIGSYDALIAGQALARDLTIVTANRREFERVEGLRVEDWSAAT